MSAVLELNGITKHYPGVTALDSVDVSIQAGSVHALMGENGAGKSTLGKVICGLIHPDVGVVLLEGQQVTFADPGEAVRAGIGMVHQELLFCENLSVAENLCLGDTPHKGVFVDRSEMVSRAEKALDRIGAKVDPQARLGSLPVAVQQLVQIAGAVAKGANILIFDEPTSSLSHSESERLFGLIDQLKADGVTCIYISHRMNEIFRLCDTITVLRDGRHVATKPADEFDHDSLVAAMIGRDLQVGVCGHGELGEVALAVQGLQSPGKFRDVSFEVRKGEILGFAGLVGAGRTEVLEAIFGLDKRTTGQVQVHGQQLRLGRPERSTSNRIGMVPEDRKRHGIILGMRIRENETLPLLPRLAKLGFVQRGKERDTAQRYFDRLRIRAPGLESITGGLSGGNQQKVVLAKWLAAECDVLMVDEPTRGVDVGAKSEIYDILREVTASGKAVLMVSSELPELINMADRILVFREGAIVGEVARAGATEEKLIRLMTGI
ncbi:MAG: sugar ABC transporter ATP-binding protein [Chlorobia bacterium]|nr:sugar ABC transporter ATP-binding protein [Fimbriimonadaceae bacterium]